MVVSTLCGQAPHPDYINMDIMKIDLVADLDEVDLARAGRAKYRPEEKFFGWRLLFCSQ